MSLRLYYRPSTGRPMRVAWALNEAGATFELVRVTKDEVGMPEHRARQPLGRVPALEIDGVELFDSTALIFHVADRYPEAGLNWPPGSVERALAYQWALTSLTEMEGPAVRYLLAQRSEGSSDGDERARRRFAAVAEVFVAELEGGREFLVGDRLTVADIVTGGVLSIADLSGLLDSSAPALAGYLDGLRSRPAYRRAADQTESLFASA